MADRSIVLTLLLLFFFSACGTNVKQGDRKVNFSVAVCPSIITVSPQLIDENGNQKIVIFCFPNVMRTELDRFGNTSKAIYIIAYTDGHIITANIEEEILEDASGEEIIQPRRIIDTAELRANAFLHESGEVIASAKSSGKTDLLIFNGVNREYSDITISTSLDKNSKTLSLLLLPLQILTGKIEGNPFNYETIILTSTYINTKNLSSVVFPVFDSIQLILSKTAKISEITVNIPDQIKGKNIDISLGTTIPDIVFLIPPLFPILSDINFSYLKDIFSQRNFYFQNVSDSIKLPIYLENIASGNSIFLYAMSEEKIMSANIPITSNSANLEIIPEDKNDINSNITFIPPDERQLYVEIYGDINGSFIALKKSEISQEKGKVNIKIPAKLAENAINYQVNAYQTIEEIKDGKKVNSISSFISLSPSLYITYKPEFFKPEKIFIDAEINDETINLSWGFPSFPDTPNSVRQIASSMQCLTEDGKIKRDCLSVNIDIIAEDEGSKNVFIWQIYNLDGKNNIKIPNFTSRRLAYLLSEKDINLKIKKIRLNYSLYLGISIISGQKEIIPN